MKVGIDISKRTFDAAIQFGDKFKSAKFENNEPGFLAFAQWVMGFSKSRPHICMEATGRYGQDLAQYCFVLDWDVSVVNPRQVKDFAGAMLRRHKTDKLDAQVLQMYASRMPVELWYPKTKVQEKLQENQAAIELTTKMIVQLENFLSSGIKSGSVKETLNNELKSLRKTLTNLQTQADELISADEELSKNRKILKSMIGVADVTARFLLSRIDFSRFTNARALTSFLGLNPRKYSSGTSLQKRECISKVGHSGIRSALYFPAVVAMTHDPALRQFALRLREQGKPEKVIITAVMRKLLTIAFALLRSGTTYDPSKNLVATT
jgi:transposase